MSQSSLLRQASRLYLDHRQHLDVQPTGWLHLVYALKLSITLRFRAKTTLMKYERISVRCSLHNIIYLALLFVIWYEGKSVCVTFKGIDQVGEEANRARKHH
jgi:hypothetical protein